MCGPLMLALPLPASERMKAAGQALLYQTGRIVTYGGLGVFFGLMGKGLALAGLQQWLSLGAGVLLIAAALFALRWEQAALSLPGIRQATQKVQKAIGRLLQSHPSGAALGIGLLNGLLPCGMVYAALAGAISTGAPVQGALFMLLFGLGTWPLMLGLMFTGQRFGPSLRKQFRIIQPVLLAVTGLLLISRGLHLDLSLFESAVPPADIDCH